MGAAQQQHLAPRQEQPQLAPGPGGQTQQRGLALQQCWRSQAEPPAALGASLSHGGMGEGEELL